MDRLAKLVAAFACLFALCSAHAGYAQLATPERFGGAYPNFTFAPSANDAKFGNIAFQPNGLKVPVPGTPTTMPAAYRFAANAPRVAAGVIFMHPALRTAAGIAAWLATAKIVWDEVEKRWKKEGDLDSGVSSSDGYLYRYSDAPLSSPWYQTHQDACHAFVSTQPSPWYRYVYTSSTQSKCYFDQINRTNSNEVLKGSVSISKKLDSECPANWYHTPAGCIQTPPPKELGRDQFEDALLNPDKQPGWPRVPADWPMPESVPWELPFPTPLPVQPPMINPAPSTNPNPLHNPRFVPTGDPVANPRYDPNAAPSPQNQPYIQPGIRVQPSPTPTEPWRVDLQPVNRPTDSTDPKPDPGTDPGDNDKPKPDEEQSLCEKHPDILACQKLDDPGDKDLQSSEKPISITPDSGWGADNATCPAPRHLMVQGRDIPIPFDLFCTWAQGIRPIILAMAWLSAAFILLGARDES